MPTLLEVLRARRTASHFAKCQHFWSSSSLCHVQPAPLPPTSTLRSGARVPTSVRNRHKRIHYLWSDPAEPNRGCNFDRGVPGPVSKNLSRLARALDLKLRTTALGFELRYRVAGVEGPYTTIARRSSNDKTCRSESGALPAATHL